MLTKSNCSKLDALENLMSKSVGEKLKRLYALSELKCMTSKSPMLLLHVFLWQDVELHTWSFSFPKSKILRWRNGSLKC